MESATNEYNSITISDLPVELISMILRNNDCFDIIRFSSTCKHFNEVIKNNQCLWKYKLKRILPADIFEEVEKHGSRNWLNETKQFYVSKQNIFTELLSMSPQYYWRGSDICYEDMRNFYSIALSNNINYYYTICVLQDIIKKCRINLDANKCEKLNPEVCPFLYGATLCALKKKDGVVRPIAIGSTIRRLTAKLGRRTVREEMAAYLRPNQLGFGTQLGCEVAIHATRTFLSNPDNKDNVVVKLDIRNAFVPARVW